MTRIVNNCVALVCLCLFWGQSLRAADASHSEQIKWGNESVFNEEHNTLGLFSGVLGGQIVLAGGTSDDYSRWGRNAVCLSENAGFALYEDVLSKPLAYGASITLSDGILCIGGRDSSQCYEDVFLVTMQHPHQTPWLQYPPRSWLSQREKGSECQWLLCPQFQDIHRSPAPEKRLHGRSSPVCPEPILQSPVRQA